MWRMLGVLLLFSLGLVFAASRTRGQEQPKQQPQQPAESEEENPKPYTPPSAAKSVEIANYYFRTHKYNAALSRYQEAVATDPYYAEGYLGLGKTYEKIGLKRKALAAYQKYLDLLPSAKQAEEAKDVHRAIARLEKASGVKSAGPKTPSSAATAAKAADQPR